MTKVLAEPRRPVDDWRQILDAWIAEVEQIICQARGWAEKRGWATKESQKVVTEGGLGTYEVPKLLIHTPEGRLLLDPVAREVVGAAGRLEFCVMPSYDSVAIINQEGIWRFFSLSRTDLNAPWSEEAFEKVALELLKLQ